LLLLLCSNTLWRIQRIYLKRYVTQVKVLLREINKDITMLNIHTNNNRLIKPLIQYEKKLIKLRCIVYYHVYMELNVNVIAIIHIQLWMSLYLWNSYLSNLLKDCVERWELRCSSLLYLTTRRGERVMSLISVYTLKVVTSLLFS